MPKYFDYSPEVLLMIHEALRDELLEMRRIDQDIRNRYIGDQQNRDLLRKMGEIDRANTKRMHEIVAEHGWPGSSLVGEEAASAAWLMVQHADQDREFQKQCLALIQEMPPGEVSPTDLAYLVDRVRAGDGQPQVYGTQFWIDENGKYGPRPIEDEANVDARRAAAGLGPLAEYRKQLEELFRSTSEGNDTSE